DRVGAGAGRGKAGAAGAVIRDLHRLVAGAVRRRDDLVVKEARRAIGQNGRIQADGGIDRERVMLRRGGADGVGREQVEGDGAGGVRGRIEGDRVGAGGRSGHAGAAVVVVADLHGLVAGAVGGGDGLVVQVADRAGGERGRIQ